MFKKKALKKAATSRVRGEDEEYTLQQDESGGGSGSLNMLSD